VGTVAQQRFCKRGVTQQWRGRGVYRALRRPRHSIHCRSNVFSDPLPGSGLIRHNNNMDIRETDNAV
jgi:hypothetical protein